MRTRGPSFGKLDWHHVRMFSVDGRSYELMVLEDASVMKTSTLSPSRLWHSCYFLLSSCPFFRLIALEHSYSVRTIWVFKRNEHQCKINKMSTIHIRLWHISSMYPFWLIGEKDNYPIKQQSFVSWNTFSPSTWLDRNYLFSMINRNEESLTHEQSEVNFNRFTLSLDHIERFID